MWGYNQCRTVSDLLWNYTANKLSDEEIEQVEKHLAGCGPCRAEADAYRQTVGALTAMRSDRIPQSRRGWQELQKTLETRQRSPGAAWWRLGLTGAIWASAPVLAASAILLAINRPAPVPNGWARVAPQNHISATEGARSDTAVNDPDQQDPFDFDNTYFDTPTVAATGAGVSNRRHVHRAYSSPTVRSLANADRSAHHSARPFSNGPSMRNASARRANTETRLASNEEIKHLDGAGFTSTAEPRTYVLAPVSAASDSDSAADYVMGGVIMNARSTDVEEARGL